MLVKNNLRNGMLVCYRNGNIRMYMNRVFIGNAVFMEENSYNEELIHIGGDVGLDIVKVSKVLASGFLPINAWSHDLIDKYLLWDRKDDIEWKKKPLVKHYSNGEVVRVVRDFDSLFFHGVVVNEGKSDIDRMGALNENLFKGHYKRYIKKLKSDNSSIIR